MSNYFQNNTGTFEKEKPNKYVSFMYYPERTSSEFTEEEKSQIPQTINIPQIDKRFIHSRSSINMDVNNNKVTDFLAKIKKDYDTGVYLIDSSTQNPTIENLNLSRDKAQILDEIITKDSVLIVSKDLPNIDTIKYIMYNSNTKYGGKKTKRRKSKRRKSKRRKTKHSRK